MAWNLIDGEKELACRTAEASALRTKLGITEQIQFDFDNKKGFAEKIELIGANTTATSSDLVAGKAAYANNQIINGEIQKRTRDNISIVSPEIGIQYTLLREDLTPTLVEQAHDILDAQPEGLYLFESNGKNFVRIEMEVLSTMTDITYELYYVNTQQEYTQVASIVDDFSTITSINLNQEYKTLILDIYTNEVISALNCLGIDTTVQIVPENGLYNEVKKSIPYMEEQTIQPSKTEQVLQTTNKYLLGDITIDPIPSKYVDTTDSNAVSSDIRATKTAFVNGNKISGSVQTKTSENVEFVVGKGFKCVFGDKIKPISQIIIGDDPRIISFNCNGVEYTSIDAVERIVDIGMETRRDVILYYKYGSSSTEVYRAQGKQYPGTWADETYKTIYTEEYDKLTALLNLLVDDGGATRTEDLSYTKIPSGIYDESITKYVSSGVVNTNNATAESKDILKGKSAFVSGKKISGTLDTSTVIFPLQYASSSITSMSGSQALIGERAFLNCSSLSTVSFPYCDCIGSSAFSNCTSLSEAYFNNCEIVKTGAFGGCANLSLFSCDNLLQVNDGAFAYCMKLSSVNLYNATWIGYNAFRSTPLLEVSANACSFIGNYAFANCSNLSRLHLLRYEVCRLGGSQAFQSTPIQTHIDAKIMVPNKFLASYRTATNWTYFSDKFVGV